MAYLDDSVLDGAISVITGATSVELHICSQEPATRTEAVTTYSLGSKSGPTISGPSDGDVSGRKATIASIGDGTVTGSGTASHWALVDGSSLLAAGSLSASQSVTSGNEFTLTAIDIEIPDA